MPDLKERQRALEETMCRLGADRYRDGLRKSKEAGRPGETGAATAAIRRIVEPLAEGIKAYHETPRKRGVVSAADRLLAGLDPHVLAFITSRTVLNGLCFSRGKRLTALARDLGRAIEDQVRLDHYVTKDKRLFDTLEENLRARTSNALWRKRVLDVNYRRRNLAPPAWTVDEQIKVGLKLIELYCQHTGLAKVNRGPKTQYIVTLDAELQAAIDDRENMDALLSTTYLPTLIPPKPWTSLKDGGYHFLRAGVRPTIIAGRGARTRSVLNAVARADMPAVFDALNTVQSTAWAVNRRVLEVLDAAWASRAAVGGLPPADNIELPPRPHDVATNRDALRTWKYRATRVHEANGKLNGRRFQVMRMIALAHQFKDEEAIYFPYQLDFRGRLYAMPDTLNPQGHDRAKALLHFANGKPLGNYVAAGWLAIHGANLWGFDKVSLEDRVQWTEEHEEMILSVSADPLDDRRWEDADKPWQFLAFCFEWAGFKEQGLDFVSRLAIHMDGSCNGLQHFSAMLRDPIGGAAVNLVPSRNPQDIYQQVADVTIARLKEDPSPMAAAWLAYGIDRKITKRPVMVLPYGGTLYAARKYVDEALEEGIAAGRPDPSNGDDRTRSALVAFLASHIWSAIGKVVVAARAAMSWIQGAARVLAKRNLPLRWTSPSGFPVVQDYRDLNPRLVKTHMHGRLLRLKVYDVADKIDVGRQALASSPNFIHSFDAAALTATVNLALDNGVTSFSMIHDAYGTLAADTEMLGACLRRAFVDMYDGRNWLEELREQIVSDLSQVDEGAAQDLAPVPPTGTLDIQEVLNSDFFFA